MYNLFDILGRAQGGTAFDTMARQFGLSPPQTQSALEALLPAFTMGLQRSAMNPAVLAGLFTAMGSGNQTAPWFNNPLQAFAPQAQQQGTAFLNQLFGSPQVSRRVADQAGAFSGVGAEVMQQMMPVVAATLMGGLAQQASREGIGDALIRLGTMLGGRHPAPRPGATARSSGGEQGWGDLMAGLFGQVAPSTAPAAPPTPMAARVEAAAGPNPFLDLMNAVIGVGARPESSPVAAPPSPTPPPEAKPVGQPEAGPNPFELWGRMFETGREVQQHYLDELKATFDEVKPPENATAQR